jgi:3-hydroxy acid dehydrogenase/malonic semialdehyde reductase
MQEGVVKTFRLEGRWALITGATAGIGLATAELLADRGCNVVLTGRRQDRLAETAERLTKKGVQVQTMAFDLSSRAEAEKAFGAAKATLEKVSILVNNAGLARGTDKIQDAQLDDLDAMVDTNVKGLLYATRTLLPHLIKNRESHVVNVGSVAGRWVYPGGAVYCATKFAVRALSEALRMDLMGHPVRVTNIEPGMVETEFSEVRLAGDKEKAKAVYRGLEPLRAEDIAETIVWCLERPAHVNIQELIIYPTAQAGVGPSYTTRETTRDTTRV